MAGGGQQIFGGPVASQEVIKELGTNGGGFFNANSAHPFENPTWWTDLFEIFLILMNPVQPPARLRPDDRLGRAGSRYRLRDGHHRASVPISGWSDRNHRRPAAVREQVTNDEEMSVSLASRLLSPAGFVLFLLCFLLPFVAVSCDAGAAGKLSVSYTGLDLLTNGDATVVITGSFADAQASADGGSTAGQDEPPSLDVAPIAAIAVALGVLGLASAALPTARRRLQGGLALAMLALIALIANQWVARSRLVGELKSSSSSAGAGSTFGGSVTPESLLNNRPGFNLAVLCLILVGLGSGGLLVTERVRAKRAAQPPAAPPYLFPPAGAQGYGPPSQYPGAQYPGAQYPAAQHPTGQYPAAQYPPPYEGQPDQAQP